MRTAIFACNTIREEVTLALTRTGCTHDVYWLESNLHNFPDRLHVKLQEGLDQLGDYDRILLVMGYCGNSVAGLKAGNFEMILPRVDDCISLMCGSAKKRAQMVKGHYSIFMTAGWLRHESNIESEYEYTVKKYGEEAAKIVMEMMYGHYDWLSVLDTGAYDVASILPRTQKMAESFGLEQHILPGTVSGIEELLTGPWPEDQYIIIPPGKTIPVEELVV